MAIHPCKESEFGARRGSNLTLTWWKSSTTATAEQIAVDGGGFRRRRCAGDKGDDPKTWATAATGCGNEAVLRNFNHSGPRGIYTHMLSVAPSWTIRWHQDVLVQWPGAKSVTLKISSRSVRDAFGGNLNLKSLLESNLRNLQCKGKSQSVARIMANQSCIESEFGA
jgi:hypothetical protein